MMALASVHNPLFRKAFGREFSFGDSTMTALEFMLDLLLCLNRMGQL